MSEENSTVAKSIRMIVQKLDSYTSATKKKFFEMEEILEGFRAEIDQLKGTINALQATPAPTSVSSEDLGAIMERLTVLENKVDAAQQTIPATQPTTIPTAPVMPPKSPVTNPTPAPVAPARPSPPTSPPTSPPVIPPPRSTVPVSTSSIPASPPVRPTPSLPKTPPKQVTPTTAPPVDETKPVETPMVEPAKSDDETKSLMDALKKLESL